MSRAAHAHVLLTEWATWSVSEGVIPKQLHDVSAKWQKEVASDYPEESDPHRCGYDDETMSDVDRAVCSLKATPKHYVVILDTYRNRRQYQASVVEEALDAFIHRYWSA